MKVLVTTEFGNPILRKKARKLRLQQIKSAKIQALIIDMKHTLITKKMGVGVAAPQVGESLALSVIAIRPTPHRPNVKPFDLVIINPEIVEASNIMKPMWEGCLSAGKESLFAKVPRNNTVVVKYLDAAGVRCEQKLTGLRAQVVQHEVDHLNGILFVDHVKDTKSYMTLTEYKKRVVAKRKSTKQ
jgi:peptide deformylase